MGGHLNELTYKDNKIVIDLFEEYPLGIFHLLDSSSAAPSTDSNLLSIMTKTHKSHAHYKVPRSGQTTFIIIHTAKDVEYSIVGFR